MKFITKYYYWLIAIFIFLGLVFRIIWPLDMEWKADEQLMVKLASDAVKSGKLPWIGMQSGGGIVNAGFSVWPFALIFTINPSPVFMAQCVQWSNVLAIFIFIVCILNQDIKYRKILFAGLASYSIALMPVLFSRKIWAQDLLPIFVACMWYCYCKRDIFYSLLLLGLISALAGQLHLSGFFYGLGLIGAALIAKHLNRKQALFYISGFVIGILPALPWIGEVLTSHSGQFNSANIWKFEFWLHSVIDPLGINIMYSLGSDTMQFASLGTVLGYKLYLPVIITLTIISLFLVALFKGIKRLKKTSFKIDWNNPILFLSLAFIIIPGFLLTFSGIPIRSHYLIIALPFLHIVFIGLLSILKNKWVLLYISMQACITFSFLYFIHQKQEINGDYGKTYRKQEMMK